MGPPAPRFASAECSDSLQASGAGFAAFWRLGWEEAGLLGHGARGPVRLVKQQAGRGAQDAALKCSTAQEVRALRAMAHCDRVVELHSSFCNFGDVWACLQVLEGGSLRAFLRKRGAGQVSESQAVSIVSQVARGLAQVHHAGWMHRDVKCENIGFVTPDAGAFSHRQGNDCEVKLFDFDQAIEVRRGEPLTEIIGTIENMAPEVFAASYDERADCWSLGVVTYEVLFGYRPFNDISDDGVEEMVRKWDKYLLVPSDCGQEAESFVLRLLTGREERMSSADALRHSWLAPSSQLGPLTPRELAPDLPAPAQLLDPQEQPWMQTLAEGVPTSPPIAHCALPPRSPTSDDGMAWLEGYPGTPGLPRRTTRAVCAEDGAGCGGDAILADGGVSRFFAHLPETLARLWDTAAEASGGTCMGTSGGLQKKRTGGEPFTLRSA